MLLTPLIQRACSLAQTLLRYWFPQKPYRSLTLSREQQEHTCLSPIPFHVRCPCNCFLFSDLLKGAQSRWQNHPPLPWIHQSTSSCSYWWKGPGNTPLSTEW